MSRQDQTVSQGGEAYQAGGNLVVHRHEGMPAAQMVEIMGELIAKMTEYVAEARCQFEGRCNEFKEEILREFSRKDTNAESGAFRDPDYQFATRQAYESFGRSGEAQLKNELVRLLSERSRAATGSRRALILNEAIGTAGNLTPQEYSVLVSIFIIRYAHIGGNSTAEILGKFSDFLNPFIDNIPDNENSIDYLQSMRCIIVNQFAAYPFVENLRLNYSGVLNSGFTVDEFNALNIDATSKGKIAQLLQIFEPVRIGYVRFAVRNQKDLEIRLSELDVKTDDRQPILDLHATKILNVEEVRAWMKTSPELTRLEQAWNAIPLQQCSATALGKTLAHSALISRANFDAPLETWVG